MKRATIIGCLLVLNAVDCFAQTYQSGSNWNAAGNWNPSGVPSGATTNISVNSSTTPTLQSGANNTIGTVTTSSSVSLTIQGNAILTIGSSALFSSADKRNLDVASSSTLNIDSGSPDGKLEIWGDLIIQSSLQMNVSGILIVHGNVTLASSGQINVSGGGSITVGGNFTGGSSSQINITGSGSTIAISGSIDLGSSSTINPSSGGTISAIGGCSCSSCTAQCSVLPVTLIDFQVEAVKESVKLTWSTATEINFDYFSLQRSTDGFNFREIAQVQGHGTSLTRKDYVFYDRHPIIGKSYYTLSSIDFDGYREDFKVRSINYAGAPRVRIYPNPAYGSKMDLEFSYTPAEDATVIITDLNGIVKREFRTKGPVSSFDHGLNSGTYIVKISANNLNKILRFIVN